MSPRFIEAWAQPGNRILARCRRRFPNGFLDNTILWRPGIILDLPPRFGGREFRILVWAEPDICIEHDFEDGKSINGNGVPTLSGDSVFRFEQRVRDSLEKELGRALAGAGAPRFRGYTTPISHQNQKGENITGMVIAFDDLPETPEVDAALKILESRGFTVDIGDKGVIIEDPKARYIWAPG